MMMAKMTRRVIDRQDTKREGGSSKSLLSARMMLIETRQKELRRGNIGAVVLAVGRIAFCVLSLFFF